MLGAVLGARKLDPSDATVAHYYRAVALAILNLTREHEGEAIDVSGARTARADLEDDVMAVLLTAVARDATNFRSLRRPPLPIGEKAVRSGN